MKAAMFLEPGRMEIKEIEKPACGEGEVLLRVEACAVCGTDVRIFYNGQKNVVPPHIIGHEIAGVIEETGKNVRGYNIGEKITVVTCVGCNKCSFCRNNFFNLCDNPRYIGYYYQGGFAEYMTIPEEAVKGNNILKVPDKLDSRKASLIEPLSCVINGQSYLNIQENDTVVIFGAGPIGCMHAELAKVNKAGQVILFDISDTRLEIAKRFKGIKVLNSKNISPVEKVMGLTDRKGADVIIVACSSNSVQEQALQMAAKKARISFFAGLPKNNPYIKLDSNIVHYKEVSLFGAFASYRKQYEKALELISSDTIDAKKFITHEFRLEEIIKAIETTKSGQGLKSVVVMQ